MHGAEIFVESLLQEGVGTIFGHPGGAILPLNDALYSGRIRHILTRHEQGAIHMAEGYARATGQPGVVLVTSGPGGTNVVTGLTDAFMDSTPVVVFTGQVPTGVIGNDAFQEADIVGMTRSCTKHNYLVRDVHDLARTIKEAFHIARTGRPGPVSSIFLKTSPRQRVILCIPPRLLCVAISPPFTATWGSSAALRK